MDWLIFVVVVAFLAGLLIPEPWNSKIDAWLDRLDTKAKVEYLNRLEREE